MGEINLIPAGLHIFPYGPCPTESPDDLPPVQKEKINSSGKVFSK